MKFDFGFLPIEVTFGPFNNLNGGIIAELHLDPVFDRSLEAAARVLESMEVEIT